MVSKSCMYREHLPLHLAIAVKGERTNLLIALQSSDPATGKIALVELTQQRALMGRVLKKKNGGLLLLLQICSRRCSRRCISAMAVARDINHGQFVFQPQKSQ